MKAIKASIAKVPTRRQLNVLVASVSLHETVTRFLAMTSSSAPPVSLTGSELLSPAEAARHLGVSPRTLANWRSTGNGPQFSKAGGVRYRLEHLKDFINQKTVSSTSEYSGSSRDLRNASLR